MRVRDFMDDNFDALHEHDLAPQGEAAVRSKRNPADLKITGLTEQFVDEIDALFPERAPAPEDSDREIWMKAGERRLVRFLIDQYRLAHALENE